MKKIKFKDIVMIIISALILFTIGFGILFFFGGTLLSILGLKYDNTFTLAKFIAIYMIISLPIEFIIYCFFKVVREVKNISRFEYNALFFFVDVPTSMVLIGMVEYFLRDVSCSMLTAFLFSSICFFVNIYFDMKFSKDENKEESIL